MTKLLKKILIIILCCLLITSAFFIGQYKGRKHGRSEAFESIVSEECWLNTQTRDIDCIEYMGE